LSEGPFMRGVEPVGIMRYEPGAVLAEDMAEQDLGIEPGVLHTVCPETRGGLGNDLGDGHGYRASSLRIRHPELRTYFTSICCRRSALSWAVKASMNSSMSPSITASIL
jgi:hypothetical protein